MVRRVHTGAGHLLLAAALLLAFTLAGAAGASPSQGVQPPPGREEGQGLGVRNSGAAAGVPLRVGVINQFAVSRLTPSLALDRSSFAVRELTAPEFQSQLAAGTLDVDVLVLAGLDDGPSLVADVRRFLEGNRGGLWIVLGGDPASDAALLNALGLLAAPEAASVRQPAVWSPAATAHPLVREVNWKAVPEARTYTKAAWRPDAVDILLQAPGGDPLLLEARGYRGRLLVMTPWMSSPDNRDYELSLQYNYINYRLLNYLAGRTSLSYAAWPCAPVPHAGDRWRLFLWFGVVCVLGVGGFLAARYRARAPLAASTLGDILRIGAGRREGIQPSPAPGEADAAPETSRTAPPGTEAGAGQRAAPGRAGSQDADPAQGEEKEDTSSEWEQVGMHRQIASFFFNLALSLLIAVPGLVLSLYVYPHFIQPYPQVVGWQNVVGGFCGPFWTVLDLGIAAAAVKYFAEYRVKEPRKAVRFLQLLCWWSILTAVAKTVLVASVGLFFFTQGDIAHLAWVVIWLALPQFPGCAGILSSALDGMQRYDYKVICDVIGGMLINTGILYGTILLVRFLFRSHPLWAVMYGDAFGTMVALYVGGFVTTWLSFLYYSLAFKKLGFSVLTLFRADFSGAELRQAVAYGWKLTFGSLLGPLVGFLETTLVVAYVLNLNASMGYYAMMATVANFIGTAATLFSGMRAGISEAHGNGKLNLLGYYITEGLHYVNLFSFVLFAVLLAIGGPLLVGFAGPAWAPAGQFAVILCLWQLAGIYSTVGDTILQGAGFTQYNAYVWILEQATRAALLLLIIPGLRLYEGILYAAIPAILVKEAAEYALIRRRIVRFDWAVMHNFVVPGLAAAAVYGYNRALLALLWEPTLPASVALVVAAVVGSLFLFLFLLGFLGGWDEQTLGQLRRGLEVIALVRRVFFVLYRVTEFGHRRSPWRNRFPVAGYLSALAEARALTEEKRRLVI